MAILRSNNYPILRNDPDSKIPNHLILQRKSTKLRYKKRMWYIRNITLHSTVNVHRRQRNSQQQRTYLHCVVLPLRSENIPFPYRI